jgi:hypothetical protein
VGAIAKRQGPPSRRVTSEPFFRAVLARLGIDQREPGVGRTKDPFHLRNGRPNWKSKLQGPLLILVWWESIMGVVRAAPKGDTANEKQEDAKCSPHTV